MCNAAPRHASRVFGAHCHRRPVPQSPCHEKRLSISSPFSPLPPPTQSLSFERCKRIRDNVLERGLPLLQRLEFLSVSGTAISVEGVHCIGRHCPHLRELDVSCLGRFDDACAESTLGAGAAHAGGLAVLIADKTRMTGEGVQHIAANRGLRVLGMRLNPAIDDWTFLASLPMVCWS